MRRNHKLGVGLASAALFGFIIYSTFQQTAVSVEACVSFKGREHCATASGKTQEEAVATAHQIGCSLITNGRDENMVCLSSAPTSVRLLK